MPRETARKIIDGWELDAWHSYLYIIEQIKRHASPFLQRVSKRAPVNAQWSLTSYGQTKARRATLSREIAVEIIFTLAEQRSKTNSIVVIVPIAIIPSFYPKCIEIDTDCSRKAHMWKANINSISGIVHRRAAILLRYS